MCQISNDILTKKQISNWTKEEIKEWDRYALRLADKIAYDQFRGIPLMTLLDCHDCSRCYDNLYREKENEV